MNYFYFDQTNQKQGPVSEQQLKELAAQGIIGPHTPMETDTGHKGVAGQIPGLFPAASPPPPQPVSVPSPAPKQLFCTNCGQPVSEQAVACMSCGAKPTGHRKFCRHCAAALNPEQVVCVKCGAKVGTTGVDMSQIFGGDQAKTLNTYFTVYWISLAVSAFFGFFVWIPFIGQIAMLIFGVPATIVCMIVRLMLLYYAWKLVPADIARTTPGKAVGFLFIPFFNLYWLFVAYLGLCKDMNKTLQRRGSQYKVDETMGMVYCILSVTVLIPLLNILTVGIGVSIVSIFLCKSYKDGAIALLEQKG